VVSRVCYGRNYPYGFPHPWALLLPVCFIESVVAKPLTVATSPRRSRQATSWYYTSTAPAVFPHFAHNLSLSCSHLSVIRSATPQAFASASLSDIAFTHYSNHALTPCIYHSSLCCCRPGTTQTKYTIFPQLFQQYFFDT